MSNNALYEDFIENKNGKKKKINADRRYLNATEIARTFRLFEPGTKKPCSHIVPALMGLESDYPRLFIKNTMYMLRVYTDEEGKEFVNRLMACLEVIDEKKRIFRAAGIDLTIDSSSPLKKLMAKRGVLE